MRKFRSQLMLSYIPLAVIPLLLVVLVTPRVATQGLRWLVTESGQREIKEIMPCLAAYYREFRSWDGLATLLRPTDRPAFVVLKTGKPPGSSNEYVLFVTRSGNVSCYPLRRGAQNIEFSLPTAIAGLVGTPQPGQPDPRLFEPRSDAEGGGEHLLVGAEETLIADVGGVVVASTNRTRIGHELSQTARLNSTAILVDDVQVGMLIVGEALGELSQSQRNLLDSMNLALGVSGGIAVLLAGALALLMSWRIARPVNTLMHGVRQLAVGKWSVSAPLQVRSRNEFGDLTRAFNSMADEVTRQQQLNRQMVADIAHDLRTPLSAMLLEIEAIEAGLQTPEQATASLREEITWLQRMVDDLRTLSLIDADKIALMRERVALYPFLYGIYDAWCAAAEDQDRLLTFDAPDDLGEIAIDPGRMRQVLGNLLDNAIRYTHPGNLITLRARIEGARAMIQVCDQGEGINPDDLPHVFDRFYRADRARGRGKSPHEGGSGLGLSIARRLVEMHGGTITAESVPGQGTTFTVRLPLPVWRLSKTD